MLITDGRVVALNEAAAQLLDVDPRLAIGAALISVVRDHRIEAAWSSRERVELELRGRRLELHPAGGALLLRDLTKQRRAEEGARELLAVLSHELRTPVASIRATLEAIQADPSAGVINAFLPRALKEAERLTRLLSDLTVDVTPPRARRLDPREIGSRAATVLAPLLERRGVTVRLELPAALVVADEDKLLQVLVNLIENAAVHGPAGEAVTVVGWPEGDWLMVEVRDRGAPLDPAGVERLFEPHSRGSGRRSGTGLGLYIVRSVARAWGGRAWGNAGADGGNAFGFSVPLAREEAAT